MRQPTRLRNLSPCARLSTAMMSVSPRAFSPLTMFEPMNPAAPVTTTYTIDPPCPAIRFSARTVRVHGERHARRDRAQQLVPNGIRGIRDLVDRQSLSPQHHVAPY